MRGISTSVSRRDSFKADDKYYMYRMKEILEAFPNKGPPYYPVQLCSHIYIGNQRNADDVEGLMRMGVTHVLNCAGTRHFDLSRSPYPHSTGIRGYLIIPAEDHDHYDIMQHFPDAVNFLNKCKASGGKAFIHCNLGVNRSGAICAAYLMAYEQRPLLEVVQHLKDKRQFILCNKNFRRQLLRFARCKDLLDNVTDSMLEEVANRQNARSTKSSRESNGYTYSTQSLDRKSHMRVSQPQSHYSNRQEDNHISYGEPRSSSTGSRTSYLSSQNYKNSQSHHAHHNSSSNGNSSGYGLESVPERKPIYDFAPSHSHYDKASHRDTHVNGSSALLPASAPPTPKSVSFRRPTATNVTEDMQRVRSRSTSPSPKLGFLSRIGTAITRQRSLTSLSRTSSLDEDDPKRNGNKRNSFRNGSDDTAKGLVVDDSSLSTTRPLRVYKRASTDSELYKKPSSQQMYRRAETIASTDTELERSSVQHHDDHLLPQEFLFHRRNLAHVRAPHLTKRESSTSSLNLLARLKPTKSKSRTNSPL